jgi:pimeloyl-ACP methyl ester carboxylesterase
MSIERFADDVAELIDRVAGGGPVDVWGYSLGALTATSLAVRHPATVRRLVLAASNIRADGYHPEITAPEQDDPRLPTEDEFAVWKADYEAVARARPHCRRTFSMGRPFASSSTSLST